MPSAQSKPAVASGSMSMDAEVLRSGSWNPKRLASLFREGKITGMTTIELVLKYLADVRFSAADKKCGGFYKQGEGGAIPIRVRGILDEKLERWCVSTECLTLSVPAVEKLWEDSLTKRFGATSFSTTRNNIELS